MIWRKIIAFKDGTRQVGSIEAVVDNNVAYFKIIGRIWSWSADEDSLLRKEIDTAIKAGVKNAKIVGSSEGGSVIAMNDIVALFQQFENVEINVHALMASAFTYLTSHFHTTVKANTQGMIHMPSLTVQGNIKELKSTLKLGENITNDYLKAYSKKTGKSIKEIQALWDSGDYWMNAQELLAEGFVDAIEGEVEAFTESDIMALSACGAPIIPEVTSEQKPKHKSKTQIMDRDELIAFLGLDSNATDEQIESAKSALKVDALKQRSQAEDLVTKSATELEAKATTLVDAAITEKKIKATEKDTYMELAKANYEATEKAFKTMPNLEKLSAKLTSSDGSEGDASRAKWTLEDYLDQDPEALEKMMADEPKKFQALESAHYAKQ